MKICFHGTTLSGIYAMLKGADKPISPWTVGDMDKTYLVDGEVYERTEAIAKAFEQAKLQSCLNDDVDLYVIECMVSDDLLEADTSVEGSVDLQISKRAFRLDGGLSGVIVKWIHHLRINKYCKPEYLMGMWENGQCNRDAVPADLREYMDKARFNTKDERPRHLLDRDVVDFKRYDTRSLEELSF